MAKANRSEIERRIDEVEQLLVSGLPRGAIVTACSARWGMSPVRSTLTSLARASACVAAPPSTVTSRSVAPSPATTTSMPRPWPTATGGWPCRSNAHGPSYWA